VARSTDYWRAVLGGIILLLVLAFPQGIAGFARRLFPFMNDEPKEIVEAKAASSTAAGAAS
jgi:branched-chain amino acid transport system permease protein